MDEIYSDRTESRWSFHYTADPLIRFLRDRRLDVALKVLRDNDKLQPERQRVLVVCGGVGGEGTYLANQGFQDVTVSDLSEEALQRCRSHDPRLKTLPLNAEAMDVADDSYDLTFVQDGLHHLPRPALGLTEMLRVSRDAAVVIEPHFGVAGSLLGTRWERHGEAINFVYRWSRQSFEQTARSYLLMEEGRVVVRRFWDHNLQVSRLAGRLPQRFRLRAAKVTYNLLQLADPLGNMFVGVVFKPTTQPPPRLVSH